jgi:PAS domain-containing protein
MLSARPAPRREWDAEAWAIQQVESSSAPAFVVRSDGTLVAANALADVLLDGRKPLAGLAGLIEDTSVADKTQVARFALQGSDPGAQARRFDLTLVSLPSASVLVVAREVTIETNLINALAASRELFRDLALCTTDFAFETDAAGIFTWVSPNGALGFSASDLHGSHPKAVFGDGPGVLAFASQRLVEGEEICCTGKAGTEHRLILTVMPVIGPDGRLKGTRGSARDVTVLRNHEREAEVGRRREQLVGAIIGAVRSQLEPRRMMLAAAEALLAATESHYVAIRPSRLEVFAKIGTVRDGTRHEIGVNTSYQDKTNGTVLIARDRDAPAYGEAEKSLVDSVASHLGVAIALAEMLTAAAATPETVKEVVSC